MHPKPPKGSSSHGGSVHEAWNDPQSTGNAGVLLKTRTLALPPNPDTASILCLQILPQPLGMVSLFVAIEPANTGAKISCRAQKACCWQHPAPGSRVPANSSVQSYQGFKWRIRKSTSAGTETGREADARMQGCPRQVHPAAKGHTSRPQRMADDA